MSELKKVRILLRDSDDSEEHNTQILEYLNERHEYLNDVGYAIAIDIVDSTNINRFIKQGVTSIPALIPPDSDATDAQYGVNVILSSLAKLEVTRSSSRDMFASARHTDPEEDFRERAIKEMMSGEQDDPDSTSSVRMRGQDYSESPMNERDTEAKMAKYQAYYDARKKTPGSKKAVRPGVAKAKMPSAKQNVEKLIAEKGYDKGEAALMREVVRNLD